MTDTFISTARHGRTLEADVVMKTMLIPAMVIVTTMDIVFT